MVIIRHRGVDIVVSRVDDARWLATYKLSNKQDATHKYGPSAPALVRQAKGAIDRHCDGYARQSIVVWRRGEDWWSGIEVENGVVPSDACLCYVEEE